MKVLVTGGRDFEDIAMVREVLDSIFPYEGPSHVIHGDARGADSLAGQWATESGAQEVACPANWLRFRRSAGIKRNVSMLSLLEPGRDIVVAFPGGTGTAHMMEIARKAGVEVIEAGSINRC